MIIAYIFVLIRVFIFFFKQEFNSCYGYQKKNNFMKLEFKEKKNVSGIPYVFYEFFIEPEAKKMAPLVADPLAGIRGGPAVAMTDPNIQTRSGQSPPISVGMGGICNEDIRVPDKMVGLSKSLFLEN